MFRHWTGCLDKLQSLSLDFFKIRLKKAPEQPGLTLELPFPGSLDLQPPKVPSRLKYLTMLLSDVVKIDTKIPVRHWILRWICTLKKFLGLIALIAPNYFYLQLNWKQGSTGQNPPTFWSPAMTYIYISWKPSLLWHLQIPLLQQYFAPPHQLGIISWTPQCCSALQWKFPPKDQLKKITE